MKMKINYLMAITAIAMLVLSCTDSDKPPLAEIFFEIDEENPYEVKFSTQDENVKTYLWNFGDEKTSNDAKPTHTYSKSGDYTVTLTVSGDGGEYTTTKTVSISASLEEMLSGGPDAVNGKTWVLSRKSTPGKDGVGYVNDKFTSDILPGPDNMLDIVGLGEEYDNEYTFYHNGNYSINNKNGNILAGWIYSVMNAPENIVTPTEAGIFVIGNIPNPPDAKWSLHKKSDLVVESANDFDEIIEETVTFKDVNYITFENDGFIGVKDFFTNAIIQEISSKRMVVTLFINTIESKPDKPSNIITASFDAK